MVMVKRSKQIVVLVLFVLVLILCFGLVLRSNAGSRVVVLGLNSSNLSDILKSTFPMYLEEQQLSLDSRFDVLDGMSDSIELIDSHLTRLARDDTVIINSLLMTFMCFFHQDVTKVSGSELSHFFDLNPDPTLNRDQVLERCMALVDLLIKYKGRFRLAVWLTDARPYTFHGAYAGFVSCANALRVSRILCRYLHNPDLLAIASVIHASGKHINIVTVPLHYEEVAKERKQDDKKDFDLFFYGEHLASSYPFRHRLYTLLLDMARKKKIRLLFCQLARDPPFPFLAYKIGKGVEFTKIIDDPFYADDRKRGKEESKIHAKIVGRCGGEYLKKLIARSKIVIVVPPEAGYLVMKYLEVPAFGAAIAGRMPLDGKMILNDEDFIHLDENMTDSEIVGALAFSLADGAKGKLSQMAATASEKLEVLSFSNYANHVYDALYQETYDPIPPYLKKLDLKGHPMYDGFDDLLRKIAL